MPALVQIQHPPLEHEDDTTQDIQSKKAGVAQLVERQPSKLNVAGSNPVSRSRKTTRETLRDQAHLAQLAERVLGKDEVTSSILVVGSKQETDNSSNAPSIQKVQKSDGQGEIRTNEAPRQRGDDWSHRPWQDDADGGAGEGAVEEESGEGDQVRGHRQGRDRSRRDEDGDDRGERTWSTRRRSVTTRTSIARATPTTSRT